eukprot:scaffold7281_cov70-Attheya_sp.AAC.1
MTGAASRTYRCHMMVRVMVMGANMRGCARKSQGTTGAGGHSTVYSAVIYSLRSLHIHHRQVGTAFTMLSLPRCVLDEATFLAESIE